MDTSQYGFSGYLEPDEIRAIINAVPQVSRYQERDTMLLEMMWQTGCRVGEAALLKPEHVGLAAIILRNLKQIKRMKGPNGIYSYVYNDKAMKETQVSEELCRWIKDFCRREDIKKGEWVFQGNKDRTKPLNYKYIYRLVGRASEHAGIFVAGKNNPQTGKQYKGAYPHIFRHSNATFIVDQVKDLTVAQVQLGHANILSTQKYAHAGIRRARRLIKDINWYGAKEEKEPKRKREKRNA